HAAGGGAVVRHGDGDGVAAVLGVGVAAADREHAGAVGDRAVRRGAAVAPGDGRAVIADRLGAAGVGEGGQRLVAADVALGGAHGVAAGERHGQVVHRHRGGLRLLDAVAVGGGGRDGEGTFLGIGVRGRGRVAGQRAGVGVAPVDAPAGGVVAGVARLAEA